MPKVKNDTSAKTPASSTKTGLTGLEAQVKAEATRIYASEDRRVKQVAKDEDIKAAVARAKEQCAPDSVPFMPTCLSIHEEIRAARRRNNLANITANNVLWVTSCPIQGETKSPSNEPHHYYDY